MMFSTPNDEPMPEDQQTPPKSDGLWTRFVGVCNRNKPAIEVISLVVGILVACLSLWYLSYQIGNIAEQNQNSEKRASALANQTQAVVNQSKAVIEQTEQNRASAAEQIDAIFKQNLLLSGQAQALWYATRPAIKILPIAPDADIRPFDGVSMVQIGYDPDSYSRDSDTANKFNMYYTLENVGRSPALLDSIKYEVVNQSYTAFPMQGLYSLVLVQTDRVVQRVPIVFSKEDTTLLQIGVYYRFEMTTPVTTPFPPLVKSFNIVFTDDKWRVGVLPIEEFDRLVLRFKNAALKTEGQ